MSRDVRHSLPDLGDILEALVLILYLLMSRFS